MLRTALELAKRHHQVEIFTLSWQGDYPQGVRVHVLPQRGWFNFSRYQRFIDVCFNLINASHFDYVFGYNRMPGLDAHFAADPCFIERAHQQRSFLYRLTPRYKWFVCCEKAIFSKRSATQILAVSLTEKPHFQRWYGTQDSRFHYIPPFLSSERFVLQDKTSMRHYLRDTFGFAHDDFVYLLTGSGFAMKGLDRAILALAAMPNDLREKTKLVAVGQDNPKHFQAMANKLGLGKHIIIAKGRTDIPLLMQGADVCVHPAYRENTGLVILEAMACGAPLLVTESCGYAEHVVKANAGLVCGSPYQQATFNHLWMTMRESPKKTDWGNNGHHYAQTIMQANDGSAEAEILIALAHQKSGLNLGVG